MKMIKYITVVLACACMILVGGCNVIDSIKTPDEDALIVKIFDAFENKEYDVVNSYLVPEVIPNDTTTYTTITDYIDGELTDYKKTGYYYNVSIQNDKKSETISLTYDVETHNDHYVVSMVLLKTIEADWMIYSFNIIRASELEGNGAIIDFKNFDALQLLLLLYSAVCVGLVIYAVVACAKSPIRVKALWIVMILLLHSGIKLASGAGFFNFNFQFISVNISYLQKFVNGDTVLQVLVPLGAVLFLCLKRRLIKSARRWQESKVSINQNSERTQVQNDNK